MKITIRLQ